jgi:spore germination cell wall hydrolase CwlJ-like protein
MSSLGQKGALEMRPSKWSLRGAVLACLLATGVQADVTVSTSTNPTIDMSTRLNSLLRAEGETARSMNSRAMKRLIEAPKATEDAVYNRSAIDSLKPARGGEQWECLTEALYFEARGETVRGMFGVAEVILNRVDDPRYPSSVCQVVNQGTGERFRCQFTYTCDGRPEKMADKRAYERVGKIARIMLDGMERRLTDGATHYHTKSVKPKWSRVFPRTTTIGYHHFYREPSRLASR